MLIPSAATTEATDPLPAAVAAVLLVIWGVFGFLLAFEPNQGEMAVLLVIVAVLHVVLVGAVGGTLGTPVYSPGPATEQPGQIGLGMAFKGLERLYGSNAIGPFVLAGGVIGFFTGHHAKSRAEYARVRDDRITSTIGYDAPPTPRGLR